jgi:hypothetical protein
MPEAPKLGEWAQTGDDEYVCYTSETLIAAIEKCLDNGLGTCLVVEDQDRFVGRISLDDIGKAVLNGALLNPSLDQHVEMFAHRLANDSSSDSQVLQPVLDATGRLVGVIIDRSSQHVQVARPDMTHDEFRSVLDAFLSSWISSKGPYVGKFEQDFCAFIGARHGIAVSNGTVALHLALVALNVGPGDEVIVPDLTFAATINAVLYCGATPVIVDVDRRTWCMSLATVEQACTPRTKAIIPVHLYGRPAEIGPIAEFAAKRGIAVVEDCAEAHGARYDGRPVGQFGDINCFSFYANKIVTTGEGGMCLTNSAHLAESLRVLRDHAQSLLLARACRLQLPHHQPAGGDRPFAALAHRRDAGAQQGRCRSLSQCAEGHPRRALPAADGSHLRARRVACLRAGAGQQARRHPRGRRRGQDRDAAVLPFAVLAATLREVRPTLSQQRGIGCHRHKPADVARGRPASGASDREGVPRCPRLNR